MFAGAVAAAAVFVVEVGGLGILVVASLSQVVESRGYRLAEV